MMKYFPLHILVSLFTGFFLFQSPVDAQKKAISHVNPFIGTGGHGHVFPGATTPFGMVQLSPDNGTAGWDWCSGYHYSDTTIVGFSHMHLSGTGIGDWLDILVTPLLKPSGQAQKLEKNVFSHANESASPGYYSVRFKNGIKVQLTASERVGFHQYDFPENAVTPTIKINLQYHLNWDSPVKTYIEIVNDTTLVGYRYSTGWATTQRVYFAVKTSVPFHEALLSGNDALIEEGFSAETEGKGNGSIVQLLFNKEVKEVKLKVALSMSDVPHAVAALEEIPAWDLATARLAAEDKWEKELSKIDIKTADEKVKTVFYTALYHTSISPNLYSDADGSYKNSQGKIHMMSQGAQRYTVYSLWDTFRALNPLYTLIQPDRYTAILNSMLAFYEENGLLPVWDLSTAETNTMTGYHAVPVLADAVLKNWPGLDPEKAYAAMLASAYQKGRNVPDYIAYGYMPQDKLGHSATVTLEYGYDDWCIAQVAKKLGKMDDYARFSKRAKAYQQIFDKETGFMRAKYSNGAWVTPFDPLLSEHDEIKAQYMEGNAWQHSFFVPHDVRGLAKLYGSNRLLGQKLDTLFTINAKLTGTNASPDVSGFIGQYAHGNEPSHHIAHMYTYLGEAWKTQERVRQILDSMYHAAPDGYAGNEDVGQMSAWAIWNISGLYPANAASGQYIIVSPSVNEATYHLGGGKILKIIAKKNNPKNKYISSVKFNGKPYDKTYFNHKDIINGGVIEIQLTNKPNKKWGSKPESWPQSANEE